MKINVLDHIGHVTLRENMGSDLTIVNAARVSYDKRKEEFDSKDRRLLHYLIKNKHTSPLRHATIQFEVYAPLFVARQWWKHAIGSSYETLTAWNESSRRYVTEEPEFYIPDVDQWRLAPDNKKQGSGNLAVESDGLLAEETRRAMFNNVIDSLELYEQAMSYGIAPEQARLFLPAYAMYVRFMWTTSLQSALHFLDLRLDDNAQWEMREYAKAVAEIVEKQYPETFEAWRLSST